MGTTSDENLLQGATIVCLANAEWNSASRINCHHIMARLAPDNQVLFVQSMGGRKPSLTSGRDLSKIVQRIEQLKRGEWSPIPNLEVISPLAIPGFSNSAVEWLNFIILSRQIKAAIARHPTRYPTILWFFTPVFAPLIKQLKADLVIYQCVDEHSAGPGAAREHVIALEQDLIRQADIVITTSKSLLEAKRVYNSAVVCLPNVADVPMFMQAQRDDLIVPDDIQVFKSPIAGFIGNLSSYKVDFELIYELARKNPDWIFVLIGETGIGESRTDMSKLKSLENVALLGPRPYTQLPAYIKGFDVCLIPFASNEYTANCFPMKFFEYLASGKPVVASPLPALREYSTYCRLAQGVEEFSAAMHLALSDDMTETKLQARTSLAQKFSWDARLVDLSTIIRKRLVQKKPLLMR